MTGMARKLFPISPALMMALWLATCSGESQADPEGGESTGELAEMEGRAEGAGEHQEGGVAREGGEHAEGGVAPEGSEHREGVESGQHREGGEGGEHAEGGEHGGEGGHDEEGEESGEYIGAAETWDVVRRGARLILSFDPEANAFVGAVENTAEQRLCAIRVEVHLSTGTELGPTAPVDLPAGEATAVTLPTEGEAFESFTAHPEASPCGLS